MNDTFSGDKPFKLETVEAGIASHPEVWGLVQAYEHLLCGRTANGESAIFLPLC